MKWIISFLLLFLGGIFLSKLYQKDSSISSPPTAIVETRDLKVHVKTVGELEAAYSIIIASSIKGDAGKIIDLIGDGVYVEPGQVLVKLDPTPFEEKIEKLHSSINEQEACIAALEQALEWEIAQAEHKNRIASFEVELAELELDKMVHGDGPQEIVRLKAAMQKAHLKFEELKGYSQDLIDLESKGFLNQVELRQAYKKLAEEEEAYEIAKQQYESYEERIYPMQVKKAEAQLKRAQVCQEETAKTGFYHIAKSKSLLLQSQRALLEDLHQMEEVKKELLQTEIIAPSPGMVVLREEYRLGQKRKPRVGDTLVKNQPLIDLPDLSKMTVKTRVREVDLFKVEVGKNATIEVDAYPGLVFKGKVSSIGVLALSDSARADLEKYFEVRILLDESNPCLRPGMTTRSTIHAQEAFDVLAVPLHSVFVEDGQTFCYLLTENNSYEKREVEPGISNEQWIEIKRGLKEGERVCLLAPSMM